MKKKLLLIFICMIAFFATISSVSAYNITFVANPEIEESGNEYCYFYTAVKSSENSRGIYEVGSFDTYDFAYNTGASVDHYDIIGIMFHNEPLSEYPTTLTAVDADFKDANRSTIAWYDKYTSFFSTGSESNQEAEYNRILSILGSGRKYKTQVGKKGGNYKEFSSNVLLGTSARLDANGDNSSIIFKYRLQLNDQVMDAIKNYAIDGKGQTYTYNEKKYYRVYFSFVTKFGNQSPCRTSYEFYTTLYKYLTSTGYSWFPFVKGSDYFGNFMSGYSAINDYDNILYVPVPEKDIYVNYLEQDKDKKLSLLYKAPNEQNRHTIDSKIISLKDNLASTSQEYEYYKVSIGSTFIANYMTEEELNKKFNLTNEKDENKKYVYLGYTFKEAQNTEGYDTLRDQIINEGKVQVKDITSREIKAENDKTALVSFIYKAPKKNIKVEIWHVPETDKEKKLPFAQLDNKKPGNELTCSVKKAVEELSRTKQEAIYSVNPEKLNDVLTAKNFVEEKVIEENGRKVKYVYTRKVQLVEKETGKIIRDLEYDETGDMEFEFDPRDQTCNEYIVKFIYKVEPDDDKFIYVNYISEENSDDGVLRTVLRVAPKNKFKKDNYDKDNFYEYSDEHEFKLNGMDFQTLSEFNSTHEDIKIINESTDNEKEQYSFDVKYFKENDWIPATLKAVYMSELELKEKTKINYRYIGWADKKSEDQETYAELKDYILRGEEDLSGEAKRLNFEIKKTEPVLISFRYKPEINEAEVTVQHVAKKNNSALPVINSPEGSCPDLEDRTS